MSDETVAKETTQVEAPAKQEAEVKPVVEQSEELKVDNALINKLFEKVDKQTESIDTLKNINEQQAKKITQLEEKLKDVDVTLKENINEVIGGYNYDEVLEDMTAEQKDKIVEDTRKSYNRFKEIFKF